MKKEDFIGQFQVEKETFNLYDIQQLSRQGIADIHRLPFSIRILVENILRKLDGTIVTKDHLTQIANWKPTYEAPVEIPFHPARVLMQDFTGVPAVVDLAAMRDAIALLGGDPKKVNPMVPVELVVDHSVQVDYYGTADAVDRNVEKEYERNKERYTFLKWAQKSFDNFKVIPPKAGICHQVNLEYLGRVVMDETKEKKRFAFPDSLVGLDSHTTMIDALGILGWGVGGIEAEAVMLGQPYSLPIPEVIGVKLAGTLSAGVTATDMVLFITKVLREYGVVGKFVEFFGKGMKDLSITDRATVANMTPEFGATVGFFPVDEKTIEYLKMTNRTVRAELTEAYCKANHLFYTGSEEPEYTDIIEVDLSSVTPCVSGPSRPMDRIGLEELKKKISPIVRKQERQEKTSASQIDVNGQKVTLDHGNIVIAAITSCTNTSNPLVMMGAGLLARNAVARGLKVPPFVKTSLAPGSKVVVRYLDQAGLLPHLADLGFHLVGYGCTTCIGNSGNLNPAIAKAIKEKDLNVASVLSGNRNFEARIHQMIKSNFLASPMLVVAFALAGRIDIDMTKEPLGTDSKGTPVYLSDIWPEDDEIKQLVKTCLKKEFFETEYGRIFDGDASWKALPDAPSLTYAWDDTSTYIKNPPYFENFEMTFTPPGDIVNARVLAVLGDATTTDHISPAGSIPEAYPAGAYLIKQGVVVQNFNSYGSRRGNHEVMMRGTFGNIRLKNKLAGGKEGSFTVKFPEKQQMHIYDAAMSYMEENTPLIVIGGKEYGTGSSRDWAAKGSTLLGVKAVIAESYERIHRNNLVGMGVLPLEFKPGQNASTIKLTGSETYTIKGIKEVSPLKEMEVTAVKEDGSAIDFTVIARLDTEMDVQYYQNGGILTRVLRDMAQ